MEKRIRREFHRNLAVVIVLASIFCTAERISAQTWLNPIKLLTQPDDGMQGKNFLVTPFHNQGQSFQSLHLAAQPLDALVLKLFQEQALDPRFQVKPEARSGGLGLTGESNVSEYSFFLGGVRVYGFQVKASQAQALAPLVFGQMPVVNELHTYSLEEWPLLSDAVNMVIQVAADQDSVHDVSTVDRERCYYYYQGELRPVWRLVIRTQLLEYEGIADQEMVYEFFPRFFDIEGTAKTFPRSSLDGTTKVYPLHNLAAGGHLENNRFKTALWSTKTDALASNADNVFDFGLNSSEFSETSLFTNANRVLEWLEGGGYDTTGFKQIKIVVHAVLSGNVNNALYQPDPSGNNVIYVGDGDGTTLQNLATDADVINHEFSHHIIYKSINRIDNEKSLILHEALADFLTFLRSGDACLGRSICPEGSSLCATSQCLRTAINDYTYTSADLPSEAHLKSQFVSGMLWDLKIKDNIPVDVLRKTVISAINYLPSASSYEHLVIALMYADKALNNGAYCSSIYMRAAERGLYSLISDFGCGDELGSTSGIAITKYPSITNEFPNAMPAGSGSSTQSNAAVSGSSSHKSSGGFCGSLAVPTSSAGIWSILLWLSPILSPCFSKCLRNSRSFRKRR